MIYKKTSVIVPAFPKFTLRDWRVLGPNLNNKFDLNPHSYIIFWKKFFVFFKIRIVFKMLTGPILYLIYMNIFYMFEHINGIWEILSTLFAYSWFFVLHFSNISILHKPFPLLDDQFIQVWPKGDIFHPHLCLVVDRDKVLMVCSLDMITKVDRDWSSWMVEMWAVLVMAIVVFFTVKTEIKVWNCFLSFVIV